MSPISGNFEFVILVLRLLVYTLQVAGMNLLFNCDFLVDAFEVFLG